MDKVDFPDWYPEKVPFDLANDSNPYGPANPAILEVFRRRLAPRGARIVDIAGGYGRYALPLAEAGHDVTVVDIIPGHLEAALKNAAGLPAGSGAIDVVLADVTKPDQIPKIGEGYDASLNAAFLYLAPPAQAKRVFGDCASLHAPGGLAVVQFNTNVNRRTPRWREAGRQQRVRL